MGELDERNWAVMSERGREGAGLTYAEAVELERGLKGEKIRGLCVITDGAARHLPAAKNQHEGDGAGGRRAGGDGTRRRPARRKGTA